MELAKEIRSFLAKYAAICPDDSGEYTSPDAYQLESFADCLESGVKPSRIPFSEWGSGGYKPYTSKEGREWHDKIIQKCKDWID